MPTVYRAREREATRVPLSAILREGKLRIRPEVQNLGYFDIRIKSGELVLTAGKFIGLIPLNDDVMIDVEPKMPASNLLHILGRSEGRLVALDATERWYEAAGTQPPSVLDILARSFTEALLRIEIEGLAKEYRRVETSGSALKGQIQFAASGRRYWARGIRHSAVSSHYDLTADTEDNRLIRYACNILLQANVRLRSRPDYLPAIANFYELLLDAGVELERPELTGRQEDEMHGFSAYAKARSLARAIVLGKGIELPAGGSDLSLPSLLLDMETLF